MRKELIEHLEEELKIRKKVRSQLGPFETIDGMALWFVINRLEEVVNFAKSDVDDAHFIWKVQCVIDHILTNIFLNCPTKMDTTISGVLSHFGLRKGQNIFLKIMGCFSTSQLSHSQFNFTIDYSDLLNADWGVRNLAEIAKLRDRCIEMKSHLAIYEEVVNFLHPNHAPVAQFKHYRLLGMCADTKETEKYDLYLKLLYLYMWLNGDDKMLENVLG